MALEWIEGSGEGTIYTYAVQHRAFGGWAEEVPFVTAYIDLDEGDRMVTVLRGVDPNKPESIQIGAKVKVEFDDYSSLDKGDGIFVPYFRVKGEAS